MAEFRCRRGGGEMRCGRGFVAAASSSPLTPLQRVERGIPRIRRFINGLRRSDQPLSTCWRGKLGEGFADKDSCGVQPSVWTHAIHVLAYNEVMATPAKLHLSRDLRRRSTLTEKIAWNMLRDRRMFGYRFKRQVVFEGFVLDFFCNELRLAIEIDGPIHENQKEYDAQRQVIIEQQDVRFLRLTTQEIEESPEKLREAIRVHIEKLRGPKPHT